MKSEYEIIRRLRNQMAKDVYCTLIAMLILVSIFAIPSIISKLMGWW